MKNSKISPKSGDTKVDKDTFIPYIYVIDRWLEREVLYDQSFWKKDLLIEILKCEFGDKWEEALKILMICEE